MIAAGVLLGGVAFSTTTIAESSLDNFQNKEDALWHEAYDAMENHQYDVLDTLLDDHEGLANRAREDGYTLLQSAAYNGDLTAIRMLLEKGANPNSGTHPPASMALSGPNLVDEEINNVEIRKQQYKAILILHEYGASYNFYENKDASFIEALVMEVCDTRKPYSEELLSPFEEENFTADIHENYTSHFPFIKELKKMEDGLDPGCVDFFLNKISVSN